MLAVDDGSTDDSPALLRRLAVSRPWLRVLRLRRNFGQSAAFDAGFQAARGKLVVTLDADRQNDPADIPRLINMLEEQSLDFVSGCRADRQDGAILRRIPSRIANAIIRRVTKTSIRDLGCSLKVYRSHIVREIRLYGEMHRFLAVLIEDTGARVGQLDVNHRPRVAGVSKYGLSRTFKVLLDLLTVWFMRGFETKPLYAFGSISLAMFSGAVLLSIYVLYSKYHDDVFVHKNPIFILSMVMAIVAVQFMAMGLIAEILVRTYFESRGRPAYALEPQAREETPHITRHDSDAALEAARDKLHDNSNDKPHDA